MRLGISWGSDSMPGGNGRARSTSRNTCSIPRRWWHAGGAAIRSRESRKAERLAERWPGPHKILFALRVIGELSGEYWHGKRSEERRVGKECRSRWSGGH